MGEEFTHGVARGGLFGLLLGVTPGFAQVVSVDEEGAVEGLSFVGWPNAFLANVVDGEVARLAPLEELALEVDGGVGDTLEIECVEEVGVDE